MGMHSAWGQVRWQWLFCAKSFGQKIPNLLVALVLCSLAAYLLGGESVGLRLVGKVEGGFAKI